MDDFQAAMVIALACCPEVEYEFKSNNIIFSFQRSEGLKIFLDAIAFYPRLRVMAIDKKVLVTYID